MSSYYKIINIGKKQYLDPIQFGEPFTWRWVPNGHHALALSLLICGPRGSVDIANLAGSWYGDRVDLVSDSEPPDQHGIRTETAEDPSRNLYAMAAMEFEDISLKAIVMLLSWREKTIDSLAEQVARNPYEGTSLLENLGRILETNELRNELEDPEALDHALRRHVGHDWKEKYRKVAAERGRPIDS